MDRDRRQAKRKNKRKSTGKDAFKLYDTYGFPFDLTEDFAVEAGLIRGSRTALNREMDIQRSGRDLLVKCGLDAGARGSTYLILTVESQFVGYTNRSSHAIEAILVQDQHSRYIELPEKKECLFSTETPFYAESGGQVADQGWIETNQHVLSVSKMFRKARMANMFIWLLCGKRYYPSMGNVMVARID